MSDVKHTPGGRHAHSLRDFNRGFQTKNVVKGAGGGARGVDFQDTAGEFLDRINNPGNATEGDPQQSSRPKAPHAEALQQVAATKAAASSAAVDPSLVVPVDTVQVQMAAQASKAEIKDDPKKQKFTGEQRRDDEPLPTDEEIEALLEEEPAGENAEAAREHTLSVIARLLADPMTERKAFGAVALTNAEEIKSLMGTPVRCAKHLLVLAGRMLKRGQPREDVLNYLASTFVAFGEDFGRRAFKDYSQNIGIGLVYPLEVRERLVLAHEDFLTTLKCRFTSGRRMLSGRARDVIILEYPEDLMITEFAVKGGSRAGYQLAPMKAKNKHGLRLFEAGEYRVLLMGVDAHGFERMEEIRITVEPAPEVARPKGPIARPLPPRPKRFSFGNSSATGPVKKTT